MISRARHTSHPQCGSPTLRCECGGRTGVNTEQPSVWLLQRLSQSVTSKEPAAVQPPSWALPVLRVSAGLNGGQLSRLQPLWHGMCGCLSMTHAPSVTRGSSGFSPGYRSSLFCSSGLSCTKFAQSTLIRAAGWTISLLLFSNITAFKNITAPAVTTEQTNTSTHWLYREQGCFRTQSAHLKLTGDEMFLHACSDLFPELLCFINNTVTHAVCIIMHRHWYRCQ